MTVKSTYMTNTQEGHNKDYLAIIEKQGSKYIVTARWGRIERENKAEQVKYEGKDLAAAQAAYDEIMSTRIKHGYRIA